MDMDRFNTVNQEIEDATGDFVEADKFVVEDESIVRWFGDFAHNWEHFVRFADGKMRPYYCGGPSTDCPLCKFVAQLAIGDEASSKMADQLKAKRRYYLNVLDRSVEGRNWHAVNKKSRLLVQNKKGNNFGPQLFGALHKVSKLRGAVGANADPNHFDIILSKTGQKFKTEYGAQFSGTETALTEEELSYKQYDLNEFAKINSLSDLEAAVRALQSGTSPTKPDDSSPAPTAQPIQASPPAAVPPAAQAPAAPPAAQPAAPPPPPMVVAPPSTHADTTPKLDEAGALITDLRGGQYHIVCANCGDEKNPTWMWIDAMATNETIECHNCGKVYQHPSAAVTA